MKWIIVSTPLIQLFVNKNEVICVLKVKNSKLVIFGCITTFISLFAWSLISLEKKRRYGNGTSSVIILRQINIFWHM